MRPGARCKSETGRRSLTDQILTLCMSERFGVREAITEATRHQRARERRPIRWERMHGPRPPAVCPALASTQSERSR
jgi:hypothetical protein